nr:MAG TPA: hypothetical protein [Caudoviricetes sp.]
MQIIRQLTAKAPLSGVFYCLKIRDIYRDYKIIVSVYAMNLVSVDKIASIITV